jgi:hypothetical protein
MYIAARSGHRKWAATFAAAAVALLIALPGIAQSPSRFESAPGPAPAVRPAPRPRPPAVEPPPAPPPQAVAPVPNLPSLDAAYAARVQQGAQSAGVGMAGNLNFRREQTPAKWQAFIGAWGPGDRISSGVPIGQRNIFVIEEINADGFADIVAGWSDGPRMQRGWRRTSGMISGNTIVTDEPSTKREIELSSDGTLHVKFRLPTEIIQVVAPRLK